MAYNNAMLYGGSHQSTIDNTVSLHGFIVRQVGSSGLISIMAERESVYIEKFCIDKIINTRRIVNHFKKTDIQSVTFSPGVTLEGLRYFFLVLSDMQAYPSVNHISNAIAQQKIAGIRLNYIVYRKMTSDEAVVNKDVAQASTAQQQQNNSEAAVDNMASLLSIRQFLSDPDSFVKGGVAGSDSAIKLRAADVLSQLHTINAGIHRDKVPQEFLSGSDLAEAVMALKKDVIANLAHIKASAALDGKEAQLLDEIDVMSHEVILRIIRDEYKRGEVSLKRLGQIIRRLVPDIGELKRLLPALKDTLLSQGMQLSAYLELVTVIRKELNADGMQNIFDGIIDEVGVSADELIETIKEDPADAARLIVLAAEIRKTAHDSDSQLSSLLAQYIEQVSKTLSLQASDAPGGNGVKLLDKTIADIQNNIVDKIAKQGIGEAVIGDTRQQLKLHNEQLVADAQADWIVQFTASCKAANDEELFKKISALSADETVYVLVQKIAREVLTERKYSEKQIADFFTKISRKQELSKQNSELPKGVLNTSATVFFLEREVKRYQRYGSPFSCVIVTVPREVVCDGYKTRLEENESRLLLPQIISHVRRLLRDLDLVGTLGLVSRNIPFVILPMTDEKGAACVVARLEKSFADNTFTFDDSDIRIEAIISALSLVNTKVTDYKALLEQALLQHKKIEAEKRKSD